MTDRTPEQHAEALRARAQAGRLVAFRTDFYALPQVVQDALYGIAAELEDAADALARLAADTERLRAVEQAAREYVGAEPVAIYRKRENNPLIGAMADPKWVRLVAALAGEPADTEQP